MSYLPGLRASLVEAARERYAGGAEPSRRRGRRRWLTAGGLATGLASAVAVAVAVVAVVGLGHRRTSAPNAASPAVTRVDLRRSAAAALNQLALPPGVVVSGLVRGTPIELWSPSDQIRIPNHVDVYRVWRIHGRPDRVITFIASHRAPGWSGGMNGTSESASSGGPAVVQQATGVITLPPTGTGIWRELALNAVRLPGGGTGLRVDSEAGWLMPRPADELIPGGVARVELSWARRGTQQHVSVRITNPYRIGTLLSTFNSLPSARTGTGLCKSAPNGFVRFVFEGVGRKAPLAVAVWAPLCQNLGLSIRGGQSVPVMAGSPDAAERRADR